MTPRVLVTGLVLLALVVMASGLLLWLSFSGREAVEPERVPPVPTAEIRRSEPPVPPPRERKAESSAAKPSETVATPRPPVSTPAPPEPSPLPDQPGTQAVHGELESVGTVIRDYRNALGGNPVGTNSEITSALLGDNPKQTRFEVPPGSTLNEKGEMVDRWRTPYFFHQISREQMEIRSAGPDRQMWTSDDVVGR